jgi:uncharacterized membrane protein YdbT with pleckstrin-like domain
MEQESLFKEGEGLIEKVSKHWIVYVGDFVMYSGVCLLFIIVAQFIASTPFFSNTFHIDGSLAAKTFIFFVILFWISFFYAWTNHYFDVWYITNKNVIAVNQKQLFQREISYMELSRIQNISFEKNGFVETFLGHGKLKIESAGEGQEFIINDISNVEEVAKRIMELKNKAQEKTSL